MENILNNSLLTGSLVLLASIFLSKSSSRFGLPILVLFLFMGMLIGSEGFGGIQFENYELTHTLSLMALCLIIFNGGVDTNLQDIKPHMGRGIALSSLGIILTTSAVGAFVYFSMSMSLLESLLIGSILAATDAAAVFSALNDKKSQVSGPLKNLLKFESGSNDPMAYFLVSVLIGIYEANVFSPSSAIMTIVTNPLIGFIGGWFISKIFIKVNNYINLEHLGLYPALTLSFLLLGYSATTKLGGNGFLAVYIFGIVIGNQKIVHKNVLYSFYDGVSWLSQIGLFVMLGLLVFPSRLLDVAVPALLIASFLIFLARPLAIAACLFKSQFKLRDKAFISWAGLKGASPIVFASFAATHLGQKANAIFDIVFFVVLVSALIQGLSLKWFAKKLDLLIETIEDPEYPVDMELLEKTRNGIFEVQIKITDFACDKRVIDLALPTGAWILFIKRSGTFVIPDGSTTLYATDKALVVTKEKSDIEVATRLFEQGPENDQSPLGPDSDDSSLSA